MMRTVDKMKKTNMSGMLYRLIYCSRNVILQGMPDAVMEEAIGTILDAARRHNKTNNITGALLFTMSGFAQVLEGAREVVEHTFERICVDPRHADVTVLSFTPTERRCFPDWAMGFSGQMSPIAPDPLAPLLGDATSSGPRVTTGSDVLRLLEKLVQREDEWIAA
jgi:hypothetical protein